jgi:hypothetical protein
MEEEMNFVHYLAVATLAVGILFGYRAFGGVIGY